MFLKSFDDRKKKKKESLMKKLILQMTASNECKLMQVMKMKMSTHLTPAASGVCSCFSDCFSFHSLQSVS